MINDLGATSSASINPGTTTLRTGEDDHGSATGAVQLLIRSFRSEEPPSVPGDACMQSEVTHSAPANIGDFLWNIHSVFIGAGRVLLGDDLKDAYFKQLGHKCAVECFPVCEGGLVATLKRIPRVVTMFPNAEGATCMTATQPAGIVK